MAEDPCMSTPAELKPLLASQCTYTSQYWYVMHGFKHYRPFPSLTVMLWCSLTSEENVWHLCKRFVEELHQPEGAYAVFISNKDKVSLWLYTTDCDGCTA